jgi:hypothetical protein
MPSTLVKSGKREQTLFKACTSFLFLSFLFSELLSNNDRKEEEEEKKK